MKKKNLTAICMLVPALFIFVCTNAAFAAMTPEVSPSDQRITLALERELSSAEGISGHLIDVDTREGVVTLTGSIDNYLAYDRAEKVAKTLKGVRSVINRLNVRAMERDDAEIAHDVEEALLRDPATDSYEVTSEVNSGVVTLSGTVDSWTEKNLSAQVAKGVKGVKGLKNEIIVNYGTDRLDSEIRADIEQRLAWDVWVDEDFLKVSINEGDVTLTGTVGSSQEQTRAIMDAWINGVKSVNGENLTVRTEEDQDTLKKERKISKKKDGDIRQAVVDAFVYDPRVFSFNPTVAVENGTVTLTGSVDNLKAKWAALEDAENTIGVFRVRNFLKVRPEITMTDEAVTEQVRQALSRDPYVERFEIAVVVRNAKVYLYGTVDSEFERLQAANVVSRVNGVAELANHLEIVQFNELRVSDKELKAAIENQFFWSPYVNSQDLQVTVADGYATIKGKVDDWSEWHAVIDNAYEAGAKYVVNLTRFAI